jgi:ankyrin repeat protein
MACGTRQTYKTGTLHLIVMNMLQAASAGDLATVRRLCCEPKPRKYHKPASCDNLPLVRAAEQGHLDVVKYLCELPLDRNVKPGAHDCHALRVAVRNGHLPVVKYLCTLRDRNVRPLACCYDVWEAAAKGHLEVLKYLATLPEQIELFLGAVNSAAYYGQAEVVDILLSASTLNAQDLFDRFAYMSEVGKGILVTAAQRQRRWSALRAVWVTTAAVAGAYAL